MATVADVSGCSAAAATTPEPSMDTESLAMNQEEGREESSKTTEATNEPVDKVEVSEDGTEDNSALLAPAVSTDVSKEDDEESTKLEKGTDEMEQAEHAVDDVSSDSAPEPFEHSFEAGDHVIRWEMLPIVYPIQIHGIVLEVGDDHVTIADFGLTSYDDGSKTKEEANKVEPIIDDSVTQKMEEVVLSTWEKMRTTENKSRLNVLTIRDAKDIKTWKKVNYGENIFSKAKKGRSSWWKIGSFKDEQKEEAELEGYEKVESASDDAVITDEATSLQQSPDQVVEDDDDSECKSAPSPSSLPTSNPCPDPCPSGALPTIESCDTDQEQHRPVIPEVNTTDDGASKTLEELVAETNMVERRSSPARLVHTSSSKSESQPSQQQSWQYSWWPRSRNASSNNLAASDTESGEEGNPTGRGGWWRSTRSGYQRMSMSSDGGNDETTEPPVATQWNERHMNPAMSSLLAASASERSKKQLQPPPPPAKQQEQQKLPKSDPPKLVLARTRFLLEHGESVLPPYHVFSSNSECIAVWCMTGRWSTLQASVFLHSTAIGNAKSATAIALGVAATQPWLVPALAGVGIAAVGMPWLILKRSKDRWEEATQQLNDIFWAQAENEVFVECIEKWSKLGATAEDDKQENNITEDV